MIKEIDDKFDKSLLTCEDERLNLTEILLDDKKVTCKNNYLIHHI